MTISLSHRSDKVEFLTLTRRLLQLVMFPHLRVDQRSLIVEHWAALEQIKRDFQINCRLETVPELGMTRIVIEAAFEAIEPTGGGNG